MLATKTLAAIDSALAIDQGKAYVQLFNKLLSNNQALPIPSPSRSHLGASQIGAPCSRAIWYNWRWASFQKFPGRIIKLFNRGHLEEFQFLALLQLIDCSVWHKDSNGKQFKMAAHDKHYGGSIDAVTKNIPELPNEAVLCEFKTHNEKSFAQLQTKGVQESKYQHYVQMQQYLGAFKLDHALYLAVNKNNDSLHAEIIPYNATCDNHYRERAKWIIFKATPPAKINGSPGWYQCRFCPFHSICHKNEPLTKNCRTCVYSKPVANGEWVCNNSSHKGIINQERQIVGCPKYEPITSC